MKMGMRQILLGGVFGLLFSGGCANAQEKKPIEADPYVFSIRVYRLPADELGSGFVSKDRGKLVAPPLPPPSASHGEIEAFLVQSHGVVKEYLAQQGVPLPAGSLACYDPASATLALRAMAVVHSMMEPVADAILNRSPKHIAWSLNILEAPTANVRKAMVEATGKSEHGSVFEQLLPQAKTVITMHGEVKGGQRTKATQGIHTTKVVEYKSDAKQQVEASATEADIGTSFELDPTIGIDGHIVDVNFALTHHYAPATPRWAGMTAGTSQKVEARWMDAPLTTIQTALTLGDRSTRLIGAWALDGAPEPERAGAMQVAFLRVAIVKVLPLEDPRAEQMLKTRGEAVEPTPKGVRPIADPNMPAGMTVRRFRIPPDFLSADRPVAMAGAAPANEPFASGAVPSEKRFTREVTAEEILKSQGIPFPTGASANFLNATSELVVRNTPANLDLVAKYVESLRGQGPKSIGFNVHVVQADAALIRKLEHDAFFLPDHSAAWKALEEAAAQGKAKIVRSLWLETKSGQRATAENVIDYSNSGGTELSDSAPSKTPGEASGLAPQYVHAIANQTLVGLRMEVEPFLGVDGTTIDLNFGINYDFAPPLQRTPMEPGAEKTQRLAVPETEFRKMDISAATALLSGSTRILSVWKPSGTPELEGDVLQAVFLRADVVKVEDAAK